MASWRGWTDRSAGGRRSVTSSRLGGSAQPRSRLFPKTRSWFALESPLELLSPLSVLRVLFVLAAVAWPGLALATGGRGTATAAVLVVGAFTALIWVGLLAVKEVGVTGCRLLVGYWIVASALLLRWAPGPGPTAVLALFLVPVGVFTALFLGRRDVLAGLVLAGAALGVGLARVSGPGHALLLGVGGALALAAAPLAVMLLSRATRRQGTVDPDTGLPNGFGLAQRVAAGDRAEFVVATVALDGVAGAREALGYQVGTELLRRAVEDLGQVLPRDAFIGRVEGDELVVIAGPGPVDAGEPAVAGPDGPGVELAATLVRAIAAGRYLVGDIEVALRAHVGLSAAPEDGSDVAELVRRASLSARRAAEEGRPSARWDGHRGAMTADDLALLADLRLAAERGELTLAYQPQIEPATGRARSVEALLRWQSPAHGPVSPGRFIPLAERTGLIDRLTHWVVAEALDAQLRWQRQGVEVPVSVNVSAKNLPGPDLCDWILEQLASRMLPASCLTVEVTETAVADPVAAAAMLFPLHRGGVRISIDDFGTGFTSLAALPTLPLDELKVDQCFVLRSPGSPPDEAIVRTVVELGHRLGLEVVAEGVETGEIADRMAELGFDLLQGYHFARPMDETALLGYLATDGRVPTDGRAATTGAPVGPAALAGPRSRR
jgi:EAL domain-containing protein (putative c-di-GMP-specific phosphodiesterase class I)/GGDEF domain-containing protein